MSREEQKPGRKERKLVQRGTAILLLLLVLGAGWYFSSRHFESWVRSRVISQLENITGGRVEEGSFHWSLWRLEIDIHDLTVHGLEAPTEEPYAHVDHLLLRLKILSLFSGDIGLRALVAEHPVIHIRVAPDGTTNLPKPKIAQDNQSAAAQSLIDLGVEHLQISGGKILWNDQHMPLDLKADDVLAELTYVAASSQFDGLIKVGKLESKIKNLRPFSSRVDAEFSLHSNTVEFKSLRWQLNKSALNFKGRVADLSAPKLEGDYDLAVDLQQAAVIMRTPQLRAGTLQVVGHGGFSFQDFSSQGKILLKKAEWSDRTLRIPVSSLSTDFSVDKTHWLLSKISGNNFGGELTGQAEWRDWMSALQTNAAAGKAPLQTGSAKLHLRAMQASQMALAISTSSLPLNRLHPEGEVSGDIELAWKGSPETLQTTMAMTVTPPMQSAPNTLPLQGEFHGSYQLAGNRLKVTDAHLTARSTTVIASGILSPANSMLNLNVKSSNASELQPLLSALNASRIPVELHGTLSFLGTISGKLNSPAADGHLELTDFDLLAVSPESQTGGGWQTVSQNSTQSQRRIHWESLSADLQLDPNHVAVRNGKLKRGSMQVDMHLSAALHEYTLDDHGEFSAAITARNASLEDLQGMAGTNYPLTGTMNFNLQLSGTRIDPRGEGSFEILNGTAMGRPFQSLRSSMQVAQQEVQLNPLVLSLNGTRIHGTASYNLANQNFRFTAAGENFDLARVQGLNSERLSVQGEASFQASGSGTLEAPVLNAKVSLRNLVLNGERQGDMNIDATTKGADLHVQANSQMESATLQMDGDVHLRDPWPADITLKFSHLDFDPFLHAYLQGHITGHSSADGSIHLRGALRDLKRVDLTGELSQLAADIENVKLHSEGPVRFSSAQGILKIEQARIVGEGTDFSLQGTVPFSKEGPVNFNANGELNLKVLQGYYPGLQSYGSTTIAMKVQGSLAQPEVGGQIKISNAGLSLIDLPNGLSEMNGTLFFTQNHLQIQSLTARTGGGELALSGFIAYSRGLYFDLAATGNDIRLRYPPGVSAEASANLRLAGSLQNATLSGDITVNKFNLTSNFDFGSYLARSKQSAITTKADSPLNHVHFAVHVVTRPELQVQSSLAKVTGDADLNVRGTAARPVVLGRVNISSGDIFFNGAKYHLERGDILFTNPLTITPILDMEATTRVRDYDITLGFHGSIDKLTATYRSDPPLPSADIIALLALGRTREEQILTTNGQSPTSLSDSAANAILGQALNYALSSRVQRLFGGSRIKIDPQVGEPGTPNARLTVEQGVSDRVTLTYITNLSQSAQQVIQVEIQINKNLSLVGLRDQYGVVGFDFRIRQRKR